MAIELKNVRFFYPEQLNHPVLAVPHWSLPNGEQTFIHGPSGSGKSTFLNILSGLLKPQEGEVNVFGQRLEQMTGRQLDSFRANHIGYVFQQFNLIPYLNAVDNVLLASQFAKQKSSSNLSNKIKSLLADLNIDQKNSEIASRNLSIGQQQRVAIARALINKPQLLIVDEPTSSLDTVNRDAFMKLLMSVVRENNTTLVFVSHDLSLSDYFSRVEPLSEINQLEVLA